MKARILQFHYRFQIINICDHFVIFHFIKKELEVMTFPWGQAYVGGIVFLPNVNQLIYFSSSIGLPNFELLAQMLFEKFCQQVGFFFGFF